MTLISDTITQGIVIKQYNDSKNVISSLYHSPIISATGDGLTRPSIGQRKHLVDDRGELFTITSIGKIAMPTSLEYYFALPTASTRLLRNIVNGYGAGATICWHDGRNRSPLCGTSTLDEALRTVPLRRGVARVVANASMKSSAGSRVPLVRLREENAIS